MKTKRPTKVVESKEGKAAVLEMWLPHDNTVVVPGSGYKQCIVQITE